MSADDDGEARGAVLVIPRETTTMDFLRIPMALADKAPEMVEQRTVGRMVPPLRQQQTRPRQRQEMGRMLPCLLQAGALRHALRSLLQPRMEQQ